MYRIFLAKFIDGNPTIQMMEFNTIEELQRLFPTEYVIQILEWAVTATDNDTLILGSGNVVIMYIETDE